MHPGEKALHLALSLFFSVFFFHYIATSQLIWIANQLTSFYMTVLNKLKNSTANVNNKFAIKKYTPERIAGKENIKLLVQRTRC